jgi:hypothetical protein
VFAPDLKSNIVNDLNNINNRYMNIFSRDFEYLANEILNLNAESKPKPDYSNRDFINAVIIFQSALMDKMFDMQISEKMPMEDRKSMATKCGESLRSLIHTYTNLDTHKIEQFL